MLRLLILLFVLVPGPWNLKAANQPKRKQSGSQKWPGLRADGPKLAAKPFYCVDLDDLSVRRLSELQYRILINFGVVA